MSLAEISAAIKAFAPLAAQVAEMKKAIAGMGQAATSEEDNDDMGGDKGVPPGAAGSAAATAAAPAAKKDDGAEGSPAGSGMDERTFVERISKRDTLAAKISKHVGAFDHARMTLDDVVAYGCEKLGIKAEKAVQGAALDGYLQARPAAVPSATVAGLDSANANGGADFISKHLKGE